MTWIDNNKFTNQTNLGWTFVFEANGKYPMIANRIFETKAGAETFIKDNATAIPGLILRVIEDTTAANNGAYLVEKNGETELKLTRIVTGTLDISSSMVDIIYYEGDATYVAGLYNKADGTGEPWIPSKNAQPIKDEQVDAEGKYLCLVLNDADWVYIKSTDLIDLTDYYTKDQVDDKISILDSSVSDALDGIREYINTQDDKLDEKINALDSSLNNLTDDLVDVHEFLDDIKTQHETDVERINANLNSIDTSIEQLKSVDASLDNKIEDVSTRLAELEVRTVDSISTEGNYIHVDTSRGVVTFTADVVDSSDKTTFPSSGLVTNGYVEERLDVFNWIEI